MPSYSQALLATSPLFYARLQEPYAASPGAGYAVDLGSGTAANGTINGTVDLHQIGPYKGSYAYDFDGSTGYVDFGNPTKLQSFADQICINFWLYKKKDQGNFTFVASKGSWAVLMDNLSSSADLYFAFNQSGVGKNSVLNNPIPPFQWTMITCVYDGVSIRQYVNGVINNNATQALTGNIDNDTTHNLQIGAETGGGLPSFQGSIAEFSVFNAVPADAQILAWYQAATVAGNSWSLPADNYPRLFWWFSKGSIPGDATGITTNVPGHVTQPGGNNSNIVNNLIGRVQLYTGLSASSANINTGSAKTNGNFIKDNYSTRLYQYLHSVQCDNNWGGDLTTGAGTTFHHYLAPEHFLCWAGTAISTTGVLTTDTSIQVTSVTNITASTNSYLLIGGNNATQAEIVKINGAITGTGPFTIPVLRSQFNQGGKFGTNNTNGTAHAIGDWVRQIVSTGSGPAAGGALIMNFLDSCPTVTYDTQHGAKTYRQMMAAYMHDLMGSFASNVQSLDRYDGVYWDNYITDLWGETYMDHSFAVGQVDSGNTNTAAGNTSAALDALFSAGLKKLVQAMAVAVPSGMQQVGNTGGADNATSETVLNGGMTEQFNQDGTGGTAGGQGATRASHTTFYQTWDQSGLAPATFWFNGSATGHADTTAGITALMADYAAVRADICTCLVFGNGYFGFDENAVGSNSHQLGTWYDEFDKGFYLSWVAAAPVPTGSANGGTLAAGTYAYAVEFVNGGEGWQSADGALSSSVTLAGTTSSVSLASIPTGPAGCTARKIYRTDSSAHYYSLALIATINDNTTTTFTDTGVALGATLPATGIPVRNIGYLGTPTQGAATYSTDQVYSRTFSGGLVLVNTDTVSHNLTLPAGTYTRISGTQAPAVNSGAAVGATVSVPARDGLILLLVVSATVNVGTPGGVQAAILITPSLSGANAPGGVWLVQDVSSSGNINVAAGVRKVWPVTRGSVPNSYPPGVIPIEWVTLGNIPNAIPGVRQLIKVDWGLVPQ